MKRWLCSKLKTRQQDKKGFCRLQLTLRNLKISQHKSNTKDHANCSRSKISVLFLFNLRNPVPCLSGYQNYCSFLFIFVFVCSDFKFRLQIIFVKKISFILVRCAQPRASSVMVEKRVLTSLLALKLFELLFFASTRQNCARSLLKSHLNFHTDNMLRK